MQQPLNADLVLVNGQITTLNPDASDEAPTALAVRGDRFIAVGSDEDVAKHIGPATVVRDLGGRRVIPGLIDSHVHFVRAGRTWDQEVRWEQTATLADGLAAITARAEAVNHGDWVLVIGGWEDAQFAENRGPTPAELDAAAPNNPVFVQMGYEYGVLNSAAVAALALTPATIATSPLPLSFEVDGEGQPTGHVGGAMKQLTWVYNQIPKPTLSEEIASTASLSREFARLGLTGAADGGGTNSGPDIYRAVHACHRQGLLRTRLRLFKHAERSGTEQQDLLGYVRYSAPGLGDAMLRVSGIGEIILYASHDNIGVPGDSTPPTLALFRELLSTFAAEGWTVQIHVIERELLLSLIGVIEEVNQAHPVEALRWAFIHATSAQEQDIPRLKALGMGILVQSIFRFNGDRLIEAWGAERVSSSPPLRAFLTAGVPVGLGSDGMRGASYNPWQSLEHFVTGRTVAGNPTLTGANLLSREEALVGYSRSAAWFTYEENELGQIRPGFLADMAVLSADYFEVPLNQIGDITSVLTLVGGDVVHAADGAWGEEDGLEVAS